MSVNSLMNIGSTALMNAQVGISVTGDNIANADVDGYSRKTVNYKSNPSIFENGWQVGTGAQVDEVERHYDYFVQQQYLGANGERMFWYAQADSLYSVESLFGATDDYGISTAFDNFFSSANALSQDPGSEAQITEFTDSAQILTQQLNTLDASLQSEIDALNGEIEQQVDEANELMQSIAELNAAIVASPTDYVLQDQRDTAIEELSSLLPIKTIEQDNGMIAVVTEEGQTLVDGTETFTLALEGPQATADLAEGSTFDGQIYFEGEGADELTIEMVSGGAVGTATFRVSLDGGQTWLTDANGQVKEFTSGGMDEKVEIGGVSVWFGTSSDPSALPATDLAVGDEFSVMPKSGLYWYQTTSDKVNITPQQGMGSQSDGRLSGGSIGGLLATRDDSVQKYIEEMDALAQELIWQVNYQHSQGAGKEPYTTTSSANGVTNSAQPLGDSDLAYADKLTTGNMSFALYDSTTGDPLGVTELNFTGIPAGYTGSSFDPAIHSLEDVAAAVNATFPGGELSASVSDGHLQLDTDANTTFQFAGDTTGVLAATGTNTFFTGDSIGNIAVDPRILANPNHVNVAQVDGTGMVAEGDNTNITAIYDIATQDVMLDSIYLTTSQTLTEHLATIVAQVGGDMDSAAKNHLYANTLAIDLETKQQSVSGVNLDEELTLLTKYQQSYQAASKLITTANEMFDIIMSLKS